MSATSKVPYSSFHDGVEASNANRLFYEKLKDLNPIAIRQLHAAISPVVHNIGKQNRLFPEDLEEIIDDTLLICMEKLRTDTFVFREIHVAAYAIGIAKKLIKNICRKRKIRFRSLDNFPEPTDFNTEDFLESKEREKILCTCIDQLPQPCNQVIRLRYYDNYSDQEVVTQHLTVYKTVDSLKNKRKICLKYLRKKIEQFRLMFVNC